MGLVSCSPFPIYLKSIPTHEKLFAVGKGPNTTFDLIFLGLGRAGQDRAGQGRTGQDRAGQDGTGQDRTGQYNTGPGTPVKLPALTVAKLPRARASVRPSPMLLASRSTLLKISPAGSYS